MVLVLVSPTNTTFLTSSATKPGTSTVFSRVTYFKLKSKLMLEPLTSFTVLPEIR